MIFLSHYLLYWVEKMSAKFACILPSRLIYYPSKLRSLHWIDIYPSLFLLEDRSNFRLANDVNMIPIEGNGMMLMEYRYKLNDLKSELLLSNV
jgi:hypothetical protein